MTKATKPKDTDAPETASPSPVAELAPDEVKPDKVKPKRSRSRSGKGPTYSQLAEGLNSFVSMIGVGVKMAGDDYCGDRILTQGPELTESVIELSKTNPAVKNMLSSLTKTSAWGGVIIAAASIALPIMAHHGLIPYNVAGLMGAPLEGVGVAPGGARNADRADGTGQDDSRPSDPAEADVLAGASV